MNASVLKSVVVVVFDRTIESIIWIGLSFAVLLHFEWHKACTQGMNIHEKTNGHSVHINTISKATCPILTTAQVLTIVRPNRPFFQHKLSQDIMSEMRKFIGLWINVDFWIYKWTRVTRIIRFSNIINKSSRRYALLCFALLGMHSFALAKIFLA